MSKISRKFLNVHKVEFVLQKQSILWATKPIVEISQRELQDQLKISNIYIIQLKGKPSRIYKSVGIQPIFKTSLHFQNTRLKSTRNYIQTLKTNIKVAKLVYITQECPYLKLGREDEQKGWNPKVVETNLYLDQNEALDEIYNLSQRSKARRCFQKSRSKDFWAKSGFGERERETHGLEGEERKKIKKRVKWGPIYSTR